MKLEELIAILQDIAEMMYCCEEDSPARVQDCKDLAWKALDQIRAEGIADLASDQATYALLETSSPDSTERLCSHSPESLKERAEALSVEADRLIEAAGLDWKSLKLPSNHDTCLDSPQT